MKKFLFMAAAGLTLLGSCSSEETIDTLKGGAIEFDNPFVNKAGRGTPLTVDNIKSCKVWGSSSAANAFIFDGTELTVKGGSSVTYANKQYWTASSSYYFLSIASTQTLANAKWQYTRPDAIPTKIGAYGSLSMNIAEANGDEDVVYAFADRTTDASISNSNSVELDFNHILSRIRFGFMNGIAENYKIQVSNVSVSGLYSAGKMTFNDASEPLWNRVGEETITLNPTMTGADAGQIAHSGEAICDYKYVIPSENASFTVKFDLDLFVNVNGEFVKINATPYKHEVKVENQKLEWKHAYKFKAIIGEDNVDPSNPLKPITFTADVENWDTSKGNVDFKVPAPQPSNP